MDFGTWLSIGSLTLNVDLMLRAAESCQLSPTLAHGKDMIEIGRAKKQLSKTINMEVAVYNWA